ncbi:transferrin-binding protein-like solute binding protein [Sphingomonas sp.]|uniref:transferrin-binding protein-like solute binding protein n=1 Tax=Sphingomonas sp. TaxID=28214 RepID=UPI002DE598D5|nr:transferrin-binding protein-like solute binding protein [Sphingomonas sp.]
MSLSYDSATGAYTVREAGGGSATFLPASKNPTESNATVSVYNQVSGNRSDQLVLFNPGASNPKMALTYVTYGIWQQVTDNGATLGVAQQYLLYGIRQAADAPSTGSASYTTLVDGLWANPDGVYSLGGTSSFTADFAAKTVTTTLDLLGKNVATGVNKSLGLFNGSGTIAALGGGFSGTLAHQGTDGDGNVYSGSFAGAFFGPQGQEMGYTFNLTGTGGAAVGAVVGKAN